MAHIQSIADAYNTAEGKAFELCANVKSLELMAECVDLFYTLFNEVGIHLEGKKKSNLLRASQSTCDTLKKLRDMYYSTAVRTAWDKADSYFKE